MTDWQEPSVTFEVDGLLYTSDKLDCMTALKLLGRAGAAFGPRGMRSVVQRYARGFVDLAPTLIEAAGSQLDPFGALVQISHGIQHDPEFVRDLLSQVKVDKLRPAGMQGGALTGDAFAQHFAGELPHLFAVAEKVAVHNYLGFTLGRRFQLGSHSSAPTPTAE
ncbi:MAG: hypothetical protein VYA51_12770 [Planctomycetota bacterium]|nr:hypothetical protein [Planctomycetota bacterium]